MIDIRTGKLRVWTETLDPRLEASADGLASGEGGGKGRGSERVPAFGGSCLVFLLTCLFRTHPFTAATKKLPSASVSPFQQRTPSSNLPVHPFHRNSFPSPRISSFPLSLVHSASLASYPRRSLCPSIILCGICSHPVMTRFLKPITSPRCPGPLSSFPSTVLPRCFTLYTCCDPIFVILVLSFSVGSAANP